MSDPPFDDPAAGSASDPAAVRWSWRGTARFWAPALAVYWLVLFVGTHLPSQSLPGGLFEFDKLLHLGAYAVLTTVVLISTRRFGVATSWRVRLAVAAGVLVYGAIDELTQPYVGRSCDLADWIADALGVGLAMAVDVWRARLRPADGMR